MNRSPAFRHLTRLASRYGMAAVLLLLAAFFSLVTIEEQHPSGAQAGINDKKAAAQ